MDLTPPPPTLTFLQEDLREVCARLHGTEYAMQNSELVAATQHAELNTIMTGLSVMALILVGFVAGYLMGMVLEAINGE